MSLVKRGILRYSELVKVYFMASPRLVVKQAGIYGRIYEVLAENNKMLGEEVIDWSKKDKVEEVYKEKEKSVGVGYKKAVEKLKKADILVMEVSGHSMSMGFLVAKAMEMGKGVIALHKEANKSFFLRGIKGAKFILVEYNRENLEEKLREALEEAKKNIEVRFNFFVTPKILNYLDWVSLKRRIPKSVFLRNLIEKEIKKDKEFRG